MNDLSNQSNGLNISKGSNPPPPVVGWVGLDWGDKNHALAVRTQLAGPDQLHLIAQKPEEFDAFFLQLRTKHPTGTIAVALEQSRGPALYALLKFDFLKIYPVNPRCLSDYRKAFKMANPKSDPGDARLLCEMVCLHPDRLRPLVPQDPITRQLSLLVEDRRNLVDNRTAFSNQLGATLKSYYPLALELVGSDLTTPMALDFLDRWPNFKSLKAAKPQTVRKFFYAHNSRSEDRIQERLLAITQAKPLTEDPALVESLELRMKHLVAALRTVQKTIQEYDQQIKEVFSHHSEADLFANLPGAGRVLAPRLAVVFGTVRANFPSAQELQCLTGVAPVKKESGQTKVVHFRHARPVFVHQSIVEFTKCSLGSCEWAKLLYDHKRSQGKTTWEAIRAVAFKWLRILWRCWQERKAYDETRYLQGLKKRGVTLYAPLYEHLPAT